MVKKSEIPGTIARRRGGDLRFYLRLLPPCLLVAMLMGCRNEASVAKGPVEQTADSAVVVTDQAPAQTKPVEPVELEVIVLSPKITVEKPILDLGEVGTDAKRTGQFKFTNTGKAPLKILQVHSCCGVATRGVEAGQEYVPGEGGTLEFDFATGSSPSPPLEKVIRLQTNDPEQAIVSLTIKAVIVRRVEQDPQRLRLFLRQENAGCTDITIRSLDGKPFSITSFKSTANAISAQFDPNAAATEFVLKPKADMEKLQRNVRGQISIDLTHPECNNVRVPFDVLPEFTINPAQLMVFNLRPEQPVKREIWVLSNYRDDFEVESVSSQKGIIRLIDKKKVGNRYQLQVEINPPVRQEETSMAADMLEVKIQDGEIVSIPFRGFYAGN